MNEHAEKTLAALATEIDSKCLQIQQARMERLQLRLFLCLCAAALLIPTLFVFYGLNIVTLLVPISFISTALLLLSPLLTNQQGDSACEQI